MISTLTQILIALNILLLSIILLLRRRETRFKGLVEANQALLPPQSPNQVQNPLSLLPLQPPPTTNTEYQPSPIPASSINQPAPNPVDLSQPQSSPVHLNQSEPSQSQPLSSLPLPGDQRKEPTTNTTNNTSQNIPVAATIHATVEPKEDEFDAWKGASDPPYINYALVKQKTRQKPRMPADDACCGSGCARCVFDIYDDQLESWERRRQAAVQEQIEAHEKQHGLNE